jgi:hypothetical protein
MVKLNVSIDEQVKEELFRFCPPGDEASSSLKR